MMKKNANGSYSQRNPISINNPQAKRESEDWWDELCKAHGETNHWKKQTKKERDEKTKQKRERAEEQAKDNCNKQKT